MQISAGVAPGAAPIGFRQEGNRGSVFAWYSELFWCTAGPSGRMASTRLPEENNSEA